MTLLRVCRVTPRTSAPSVTDMPKGSRHAVRILRPGCGGFFMGMVFCSLLVACLVVVGQFNVKRIRSFKAKDNTPICPHSDRPKTLQSAFQRMQAITRKVHGLRCLGFVEPGENIFNSVEQIGAYPATVPALIESFEAAMLETPNHQDTP